MLDDRVVIFRAKGNDGATPEPVSLPLAKIEGAGIATFHKRTQLHLRSGLQVFVVEMGKGNVVDAEGNAKALRYLAESGVARIEPEPIPPRVGQRRTFIVPIPIPR